MATNTLTPALHSNYTPSAVHPSVFTRFIGWCGTQQKSRLFWQAIILAFHGCILTPIAMLLSLQAGAGSLLWIPVIAAMAINLIPNLAALSTKITIPVFFISIVIDVAIMIVAVS